MAAALGYLGNPYTENLLWGAIRGDRINYSSKDHMRALKSTSLFRKIAAIVKHIWHGFWMLVSTNYRKKFSAAVVKIDAAVERASRIFKPVPADKAAPVGADGKEKTQKQVFLDAISEHVSSDMSELFGVLFNHFDDNVFKNSIVDDDGFTITLKHPLKRRVPTKDSNVKGGKVTLLFGVNKDQKPCEVTGSFIKESVKKDHELPKEMLGKELLSLVFSEGFYSEVPVLMTKVYPQMQKFCYLDKDHVLVVSYQSFALGGKTFYRPHTIQEKKEGWGAKSEAVK